MADDLWARLEKVMSKYTDPDYANAAANTLRERNAIRPSDTLGDTGYGPSRGLNVVASPDMYFPPKFKENTKIDPSLGYYTGGDFSILGGVRLNPQSQFDRVGSATHEATHWKDAFTPLGDSYNKLMIGEEAYKQNRSKDRETLANIKQRLSEYRDKNFNYLDRKVLSGQTDSAEIIPQLRSYESMLPAGMKFHQSPAGKAILKSNEDKLYYLNGTQPSMTDQSYLEELIKRSSK